MKIGIDIDDVIVDFVTPFIRFHNKNYGTSWTKETLSFPDLASMTNDTSEQLQDKMRLFNMSEITQLPLIDGAKESINILARDHQLSAITGRPLYLEGETRAHIKEHFQGIENIYFTGTYYLNEKHDKREKSHFCLSNGIELMVEDIPEFANDCANAGIKVLLFDQPWNRKVKETDNITRVSSWSEILKLVKILK